MHVIFISKCEGRAKKKTRAVIDGYANRVGDNTWITSITTEALGEVRSSLRRKATRQMAVACYINHGSHRMVLLWIVGSGKYFGRNGEIAIATKKSSGRANSLPAWAPDALLVASQSGFGHDLGKVSEPFVNKIKPANAGIPRADPIRHDIISAIIIKQMLAGQSWSQAWETSGCMRLGIGDNAVTKGNEDGLVLDGNISSAEEAVVFCIATHHRLFHKGSIRNHIKEGEHQIIKSTRDDERVAVIAQEVVKHLLKTDHNKTDSLYWSGIAIIARAALILADHKVSSDTSKPHGATDDGSTLFANTTRIANIPGCKNGVELCAYNQTLVEHLSRVGNEAQHMLRNMLTMNAPALTNESVDNFIKVSAGRFEWQNIAANALRPGCPSLIMNIAAPGAGKTRMNARAAAILAGEKPLRLTVVLGLRSITLQTGKSYRDDLNVAGDELSVVIGSAETIKLHEYEECDSRQSDINEAEEYDAEVIDQEQCAAAPEWIQGALKNSDSASAVLMSPILVSTIDYIINAGNPASQSSHAIAMLRLMHSDIIIDEIDGYEPKALSAVLRIIRMSAIFGRNVIVSSGTLPDVVASYVWQSYYAGRQIFNAMNGSSEPFDCIVMDDSVKPSRTNTKICHEFESAYGGHIEQMQIAIKSKPITKKAEIARVDPSLGVKGIMSAIASSAEILHKRHAWSSEKISFGLVRVANIRHAIAVSEMLSKEPNTFVCGYHARHFMIQRYHIERSLDRLLTRKGDWQQNILGDSEIRKCIEATDGSGVRIIVIASPVEEVGRDHDFDWAIIEPSSIQSIVQTGGRVNRHRLDVIIEANIHILQYNFKHLAGKKGVAVFSRPGYEKVSNYQSTHASHDMLELVNEMLVNERFDSNLRFDTSAHKFALYDTQAIRDELDRYSKPIIENKLQWMDADFYANASLRDKSATDTWFYGSDNSWYKKEMVLDGAFTKNKNTANNHVWSKLDGKALSGLFTLSLDAMRELADKVGISQEKAFSVQVYSDSDAENKSVLVKYTMTRFGCMIS